MHRAAGSWPSPISAGMVAAQGVRLAQPSIDGDDVYWLEGRPAEAGRTVLVRRTPDGRTRDVIPAGFNVRTRVHEYGGGAYVVGGGVAYFANFADQRWYRVAVDEDNPRPIPITAEGPWRFADPVVDARRHRLICVREDHSTPSVEPTNTLVSIRLDGLTPAAGDVIASGHDFYSTPRLSPDGARLSWICWRHPNMPWDGTELWVADVTSQGALAHEGCVAGSATESIYQPGWSSDGSLVFASDRDDWWRLFRYGRAITPVLTDPPSRAEFGRPEWVFGTSTWAIATPQRMVAAYAKDGRWQLATIDFPHDSGGQADRPTGTLKEVPTSLEPLE